MLAARVLWTACALVAASVCAWAAHDWCAALLQQTPYQLLPLTAVLVVYVYLAALAVVVGSALTIWMIWTQ